MDSVAGTEFGEPESEACEFFIEVDVGKLGGKRVHQGRVFEDVKGVVFDGFEFVEKWRDIVHGGLRSDFLVRLEDVFGGEGFFLLQGAERERFEGKERDLAMDAGGVLVDGIDSIGSKDRG